ncbi:MAG: hypothetical protein HYZ40_15700 [Rhodospirillales bacterium]|nr:hypothetical protein [Rhodospirillales bacterium]
MARCPLAPLDRTEENALCRVTSGLVTVAALPTEFLSRLKTLGLIEDRYGQLELTGLGRQRADEAFERELLAHAPTAANVVAFVRPFPRHRLH